jgi:hypothetical protein
MANLDFSHSFQLTDGIFKTGAYRVPSKSITFGTNNYSPFRHSTQRCVLPVSYPVDLLLWQ